MKKQSCRMTPQEKEIHKAAGRYRRMTDAQLMEAIRDLERRAEKAEAHEMAMAALAKEKEEEAEAAKIAATTGQFEGRSAVAAYLAVLSDRAGTGNGIGKGTIFKLGKILDALPDDVFNICPLGE